MSKEQTVSGQLSVVTESQPPLSGSERMAELALVKQMIGRRPQGVYVAHLPKQRVAVVLVHRKPTGGRSATAMVVDLPGWSKLIRAEFDRLPVGVLSPRFAAHALRHSNLDPRPSGKAVAS